MTNLFDINPNEYWVYYDRNTLSSPPVSAWEEFTYFLEVTNSSLMRLETFQNVGLKFIVFEARHTGVESYIAFMNETDYNVAVLIR